MVNPTRRLWPPNASPRQDAPAALSPPPDRGRWRGAVFVSRRAAGCSPAPAGPNAATDRTKPAAVGQSPPRTARSTPIPAIDPWSDAIRYCKLIDHRTDSRCAVRSCRTQNPPLGRITASLRRALLCEAYGEPGAQAGPAVAADRPSSMGGEASSASGSPLQLFVGQSSSAGSAPRITLVSQSCCFLPATANPASPACRHPAGPTSSCVGSGRPAAA
jgi:hypothetical protein